MTYGFWHYIQRRYFAKAHGSALQTSEVAGFKYGWFFDSHVLWRECYLTMALSMAHTEEMIFGPLVTNPGVREWSVAASMYATLALQSDNRIEIGIGRGDSSRRMLGKKPMTVANMERFADTLRGLVRGDEVAYDDTSARFPWANGYELPIWIAAYGPKALAGAGRCGDGLVIQLADPGLVKWFSDQAIAGGQAAGKDMSNYQIMSAAPVWIGDIDKSPANKRDGSRPWSAIMWRISSSAMAWTAPDIPASLTAYIEGRKGYDYKEHADKDADHLDFITQEIVGRFWYLGGYRRPHRQAERTGSGWRYAIQYLSDVW